MYMQFVVVCLCLCVENIASFYTCSAEMLINFLACYPWLLI